MCLSYVFSSHSCYFLPDTDLSDTNEEDMNDSKTRESRRRGKGFTVKKNMKGETQLHVVSILCLFEIGEVHRGKSLCLTTVPLRGALNPFATLVPSNRHPFCPFLDQEKSCEVSCEKAGISGLKEISGSRPQVIENLLGIWYRHILNESL